MNFPFLVSLGHLSHTSFSPIISTKVVISSKGQVSKAQCSFKLKLEQRSSWLASWCPWEGGVSETDE